MDKLIQILMAAVGTLGFSVMFNVRGRKLALTKLGGALSWALCLLLERAIPSEPVRYFCSSLFVAVYAEVLARVLKTPATTFLIPGIIPHIPGGALYHTMRFALNRQWSECLSRAFYTFKLALALSLGIVVVLAVLNVYSKVMNHILYSKNKSRQKESVR